MTAQLIDGSKLAANIQSALKAKIVAKTDSGQRPPQLAVVLVGDDPASQIYVGLKEAACEKVGIKSTTFKFPSDISQSQLNRQIQTLNDDASVDGILLQLPLPRHLKREEAIDLIAPHKDVDGLTPINQGLIVWNRPGLYSCTPLGIMELIRSTGIEMRGKMACVVGKSILVGAPVATLLNHADATVTVLHSKSPRKPELARQADILVVATGVRGLVTSEWVKPGAVVIDVGIHRHEGKVVGDVQFDLVKEVAGYITPVPGGVGPMTIAMLLSNCVKAYEMNLSRHP